MTYLKKGHRVRTQWFEADPTASLAGTQMKISAKEMSVTGVVTHIRGDDPTNPTSIRIWIQPDEGGEEVIIRPEWIREVLNGTNPSGH